MRTFIRIDNRLLRTFATLSDLCRSKDRDGRNPVLGLAGLNARFRLIDGVLKPYPIRIPIVSRCRRAESSHQRHGRLVVPRHARLERGEFGLYDDCGGRGPQHDALRRQRRARAISWRRRFLGSVSPSRHPSNPRKGLRTRRRSRGCRRRRPPGYDVGGFVTRKEM